MPSYELIKSKEAISVMCHLFLSVPYDMSNPISSLCTRYFAIWLGFMP